MDAKNFDLEIEGMNSATSGLGVLTGSKLGIRRVYDISGIDCPLKATERLDQNVKFVFNVASTKRANYAFDSTGGPDAAGNLAGYINQLAEEAGVGAGISVIPERTGAVRINFTGEIKVSEVLERMTAKLREYASVAKGGSVGDYLTKRFQDITDNTKAVDLTRRG